MIRFQWPALMTGTFFLGCSSASLAQLPSYFPGPQREAVQYRDYYGYFHGYYSNSPLPPSYQPGPTVSYGNSIPSLPLIPPKHPSLDDWIFMRRRVLPLTTEEKAEIAKRREARRAHLEVNVPEHADLWLQNQKMSQTGAARGFHSPPLESGRGYTYQIRVRWKEQGKTITRSRKIKVRAGEHVTADFLESR